MGDAIIAAL